MGTKRVVDVSFWTDEKVLNMFSPEDRLFMLYVLTCPDSTQLGVFKLNPKVAAFHLGYSTETVMVLLDRFETKYGIIKRSKETNEVAIRNFLRYSILKGGKPVADLLNREIKSVKDVSLLDYVFEGLASSNNINATVREVIDSYYSSTTSSNTNSFSKERKSNDNGNVNVNVNENRGTNRGRIVDESLNDEKPMDLFTLWDKNVSPMTPLIAQDIQEMVKDFGEDAVRFGIETACRNGVRKSAYVQSCARNYLSGGARKQHASGKPKNDVQGTYEKLMQKYAGGVTDND